MDSTKELDTDAPQLSSSSEDQDRGLTKLDATWQEVVIIAISRTFIYVQAPNSKSVGPSKHAVCVVVEISVESICRNFLRPVDFKARVLRHVATHEWRILFHVLCKVR
ncbi:hypothetical protein MRB53_022713 [Persea americana]|uniref:Uncharacterized protein n=1 Tax=Persea americana TaxID=3435 RepID=A0ACC2L7Z2_PERAE|nr:hypothetical protein MRB53_022713 [Persea americana]